MKKNLKSRRFDVRLTDEQRRKLEGVASIRRTTLAGAFRALLEEKSNVFGKIQNGADRVTSAVR